MAILTTLKIILIVKKMIIKIFMVFYGSDKKFFI